MLNQFSRTELILGSEAMKKLFAARVAVFGIGGVGGYAVEALVRSGVGAIELIDSDKISLTNLNRQIYATRKTVGQYKTDAAEERIREINPDCSVVSHKIFYTPEIASEFDFKKYDYVIDAIDTVSGKISVIEESVRAGVPVISSMGAGNKTNPAAFEVADIYETSVCPLARVMRYELKRRGIKKLKVVYSKEKPIMPDASLEALCRESESAKKSVPGSTAFVPPTVGLIIAGEVIKDLTASVQIYR